MSVSTPLSISNATSQSHPSAFKESTNQKAAQKRVRIQLPAETKGPTSAPHPSRTNELNTTLAQIESSHFSFPRLKQTIIKFVHEDLKEQDFLQLSQLLKQAAGDCSLDIIEKRTKEVVNFLNQKAQIMNDIRQNYSQIRSQQIRVMEQINNFENLDPEIWGGLDKSKLETKSIEFRKLLASLLEQHAKEKELYKEVVSLYTTELRGFLCVAYFGQAQNYLIGLLENTAKPPIDHLPEMIQSIIRSYTLTNRSQ